jgi:hypothetical protein
MPVHVPYYCRHGLFQHLSHATIHAALTDVAYISFVPYMFNLSVGAARQRLDIFRFRSHVIVLSCMYIWLDL